MSFLYNQVQCQIPTSDYGDWTKYLLFRKQGVIYCTSSTTVQMSHLDVTHDMCKAHIMSVQGKVHTSPNKALCYLVILD